MPSLGFADDQLELLKSKLGEIEALNVIEADDHLDIAWMYSPLALPLLDGLKLDLVIFDSMDALDHFANAPVAMKECEMALLQPEDVVFTGGPSLCRRLEGRHANVHCFSSSVDASHFEKARRRDIDKNPPLPAGTRIGYVGVIDERIDLDLIHQIAILRPEWQIVMVGPVVKIDPDTLPKAPNIHYLGQQAYADLPAFIAGWDVCIQPFARNDSTKYISPTKTLEYFAAMKPVVSTSITDVVQPYGQIVFIADDAEAFVSQVERAISSEGNDWSRRKDAMCEVLRNTSWDKTVDAMLELIDIALEGRIRKSEDQRDGQHTNVAETQNRRRLEKNLFHIEWDSQHTTGRAIDEDDTSLLNVNVGQIEMNTTEADVVVIGAGPTGLSAAYHL